MDFLNFFTEIFLNIRTTNINLIGNCPGWFWVSIGSRNDYRWEKNVIFSTFGRIIIKFFKWVQVKWIVKNMPFLMYFQTYKTVFWNLSKKWVKKIENWHHVEIAKNSYFPDLPEAIYQRRNKKNGRFKMFLVSWHPLEHFYILSSFCEIRSSKITDNAF